METGPMERRSPRRDGESKRQREEQEWRKEEEEAEELEDQDNDDAGKHSLLMTLTRQDVNCVAHRIHTVDD